MSPRRSAAIAKHEFRILKDDPSTVMFLLVMPLIMMAFLKPVFRLALNSEGFSGANGAEHAVPGMAVMFVAFSAGYIGFGFFREHGWGTWERLRASQASSLDIMAGKLAPNLLIFTAQLLLLFLAGIVLFDLVITGSAAALVAVSIALVLCLLAFGMALTAYSRTAQQLNAFGSIGSMLLITLGGALAPLAVMPGWAQAVAPLTPTYWAMEAYRSVILEEGGLSDVALPIVILLAFGAVLAVIAALKFRFEETKIYYG